MSFSSLPLNHYAVQLRKFYPKTFVVLHIIIYLIINYLIRKIKLIKSIPIHRTGHWHHEWWNREEVSRSHDIRTPSTIFFGQCGQLLSREDCKMGPIVEQQTPPNLHCLWQWQCALCRKEAMLLRLSMLECLTSLRLSQFGAAILAYLDVAFREQ